MAMCFDCGDKNSTSGGGDMTESESSAICVRCFWFWILVIIFALGLLAHYHDAQGNIRF